MTKYKHLAMVAVAAGCSFGQAQAIVISDTQIQLVPSTSFGADYAITAIQDATFDDPTTLWFTKQDGAGHSTLSPVTWNVDQEAEYYLAQAGAKFTPDSIAAGQFQPLFTTDHPYALDVPLTGDFYLGVATSGFSDAFDRTIFGWIHLQNSAAGLSVLGNAMAYGEGGIVIGSTTAVPEPGTLLLSSVGLGCLALAARRRQA